MLTIYYRISKYIGSGNNKKYLAASKQGTKCSHRQPIKRGSTSNAANDAESHGIQNKRMLVQRKVRNIFFNKFILFIQLYNNRMKK